ncbi:MAG TPA: cobalamin B12-binding domain-containing protein [Firmicutes bacterium]|nr:cobalamin B12-binding domain-containing protein [Bacillota bacterium]
MNMRNTKNVDTSNMNPSAGKTLVAAAIGDCVHVAGILAFLGLAKSAGYETVFLGPATPVEDLVAKARELNAAAIAASYRLDPSAAANLLHELKRQVEGAGLSGIKMFFGGTPATCEVAARFDIFDAIFSGGESKEEVLGKLLDKQVAGESEALPDTLIARIRARKPFPLIRHHFGLPTVEATVRGAAEIAEAGVLDVLSIGPDQNAQEHFFAPEKMDPRQDGAGGVPIRTREDLRLIYEATRRGNRPLVRCYSGTTNLIAMAEMLQETIRNAWCAVPLCWYNVLDGRSKRPLRDAIAENQATMRWHAERGIPVEVNEAHHWSLRGADDVVAVTMAYLAAYNAKKMGVKHYVAQYMLNTPPTTPPAMDLAKMLAKIHLIESLHDENFRSYRQVRGGLASFSKDADVAKGQLASSVALGMLLKPDIVHVVGYSEGTDVARPGQLIESCKIASGVICRWIDGVPDIEADPAITRRKQELLDGARELLAKIAALAGEVQGQGAHQGAHAVEDMDDDPFTRPDVIAAAIRRGLLSAPDLRGRQLC